MTLRHRKLAKNLGNSKSIEEAMLKSGYAPTTAHQQKNVLESKGWNELVEKHLPDDKLLAKHEEALEATKWNDFTGEREEDHVVRLKAIDLAYKVKKKLGPEIMQQFNTEKMEIEFIK